MLHRAASLLSMAFLAILPFAGGLYVTAITAPSIIGGLNASSKALKVNLKNLIPSPVSSVFSLPKWYQR